MSSTLIQRRGGTTIEHSTFIGADREITVDTVKHTAVIHDGTTVGGYPLAKESDVNNLISNVNKKQDKDDDLTAIASLTGTSGLLKKTDTNVWILDTNTYAATTHTHNGVTTTTAGFMSNTDKIKLDGIAAGANNYTLPIANSINFGGVKVSASAQVVSANAVTSATGKTYAVQLDGNNNIVVNVPWSDTDTVYTHPTSGVTAGTYKSVTVNSAGHVTAGTNPTTLVGYGITDAVAASHVGSTGNAHGVATTTTAGFMSTTDKTKLDGLSIYTHPTSHAASMITTLDEFSNSNSTNVQDVLDDLDAALDVEKGRIDTILASAGANADTFAEIVNLVNSVDITNDNVMAGYVSSNDVRVGNIESNITSLTNNKLNVNDVSAWAKATTKPVYTANEVGALSTSGGTLTGPLTAIKETKIVMSNNNIDLSLGNLFTKTVLVSTTLTLSNIATSGNVNSFILELTNGGSNTITWWNGIKWPNGIAPTLTANGIDILGFYSHDGGITWRGFVSKDSK